MSAQSPRSAERPLRPFDGAGRDARIDLVGLGEVSLDRAIELPRLPGAGGKQDVLVEDGVVTKVGPDLELPGEGRVVEATGKVLMPAMFDAHVHFREPGQEHKEDIAHGTEAAEEDAISAADGLARRTVRRCGAIVAPHVEPSAIFQRRRSRQNSRS